MTLLKYEDGQDVGSVPLHFGLFFFICSSLLIFLSFFGLLKISSYSRGKLDKSNHIKYNAD